MIETGPFPHLITDRITITENKVSVRAALTSLQQGDKSFWFNEKIFSSFVKIYFILLPTSKKVRRRPMKKRKPITASMLRAPDNRYKHIMKAYRSTNLLDWDANLLKQYPSKVITLSDAMKENEDSIVVTPESDRMQNNYSDIFFDIEIDDIGEKLIPSNKRMQKLELVAFTHLDVKGLVSEYNLPIDSTTKSLLRMGGNSTYDILLDRRKGNSLNPPKTRTILTRLDGTPYVGDFHYHGPSNQGPGGYIGYMAGPLNHPNMSSMPRLSSKEIENTKILARHFMDDSEFVSGYFGAPASYALENGELSVGVYPDYNKYSVAKVPLAEKGALEVANLRDKIAKYYENPNNTAGSKVVVEPKQWITIPENPDLLSHYGINFGIDFYSLVRQHSPYGFFLDLDSIKGGVFFPTESGTREKVAIPTLLARTRIASIRIKRERVSNSARSNNLIGTPDHDAYDKNEIGKTMVESYDVQTASSFRKTLVHASNPPKRFELRSPLRTRLGIRSIAEREVHEEKIADICEVPVSNFGETRYTRVFQVRDYEIFSKINYGYYKYSVELELEDNIKSFFIEKVSLLQKRMKEFQTFIAAASRLQQPDVRYFGADRRSFPSEVIREQRPAKENSGNYNPISEKYTEYFKKEGSLQYETSIDNLLALYDSMTSLLSNKPLSSDALRKAIIPRLGGRLFEAEAFFSKCQQLLEIYLNFLDKDNIQQVGSINSNTQDYIFSKSRKQIASNRLPKLIKVSYDLNLVVKSFTDGELMVSYGIGSGDSGETDLTRIENRTISAISEFSDSFGRTQEQLTSETIDPSTIPSLIPDSFLFATSGEIMNLIKYTEYASLSLDFRLDQTRFLQQISMTPPDRTPFEYERGQSSFATSGIMSGLSVGIPLNGTGIPRIEPVNKPKSAAGSLRAGIVNKNIEDSLCSARLPPTNAEILEKTKTKVSKETVKLLSEDPRVKRATEIVSEIQSKQISKERPSIAKTYEAKIKMQKNNIRPTKPVKNDAFLDNQVQIKVSAPQVEVEDPRFAGIGGSEIDKAIDEIEDLVEIEVKVKPKSSSKNQRPGLSGITKLPVNTHGYAKKGKQVDRLKPKIKKNNKLKAAKALKANSLQNKQLPQASKAKKMPSNLPGIQTTQYRGMT